MRNRIAHHIKLIGLVRDNIGGRAALIAVLLAAASLTLAACGEATVGRGAMGEDTMGADTRIEETTASPSGEERMLEVRRIDSGSFGQGAAEPRAIVATSSESLSEAVNLSIQGAESTAADMGGGEAYIAVLWGRKNTGGYAIEIESARVEGDRVFVTLALRSPPEGAIVSQALTYPYAVAALEDLDPSNKDFVLTDESGRELDWPVETVGS